MLAQEKMSQDYAEQQWIVLKNYVPSERTLTFVDELRASRYRRVTVGRGSESWKEYTVDKARPLYQFFSDRNVIDLVESITGYSLSSRIVVWAQSYDIGERVSWHRDSKGAAQLLVCLQSVPISAGGAFCLLVKRKRNNIFLHMGDALLFNAAELPHCTTRISPLEQVANINRITAVGRYFLKR